PALYSTSRKARWSAARRPLHLLLSIGSGLLAAWLTYQLRAHWAWLVATAFITFLYSAPKIPYLPFIWLRRIAIGKTLFLALAWTQVTAVLPLALERQDFGPEAELFAINRFFLIYAICILFDYRDREADRREGIRSLVTQLDEQGIHSLFLGSLLVFFATGLGGLFHNQDPVTVAILLLPGLLLAGLYARSLRSQSDYLYYFVLDGLMMFSALLLFLLSLFGKFAG
ncbi:MAG TPA: UbiA family prenyltransferase, partial [Chitinophagaceae bacterium]|nr:UbiA family prenyltransferase [Chitinophagaceae bacterium]